MTNITVATVRDKRGDSRFPSVPRNGVVRRVQTIGELFRAEVASIAVHLLVGRGFLYGTNR